MGGRIEGEVLPVPDRPRVGATMFDAVHEGAVYEPLSPLRPPAEAAIILVVLLDDAGLVQQRVWWAVPHPDVRTAGRARAAVFHTTAMCSPTGRALLTDRNHHRWAMGLVADMATAAPACSTSLRPNRCYSAEVLRGSMAIAPPSSGRMDQWPASSLSKRAKTAGLSNRGKHNQSSDPFRPTSVAEWRSESNP